MSSNKTVRLYSLIISLIILMILLLFPKASSDGIIIGLKSSGELIIPSLFPYMLLSSFIIRTRALKPFEKFFSPFTSKLLNLPKACTSAIIMSFIGGFPVGAKCVSILYKQKIVPRQQAQRMMYFCVCSGPSFLITGIGTIILKNQMAGVMLYMSQLLTGIIIGISVGLYSRIKKRENITDNFSEKENTHGISDSFICAAEDSAASIITMTALICFFSMLISVYNATGVNEALGSIRELRLLVPIFTEVTNGIITVKNTGMPIWWYSAAVGFGGICVHFQIKLLLKDVPFSFSKYLLFRLINCIISVMVTKAVCQIFLPAEEVFRLFDNTEAEFFSVGITGSLAMIIMCIVFLLSIRRRELSRKLFLQKCIK